MNPGHVGPTPGHTIEEDFQRFHEENPHVYERLVVLARAWRERRQTGVGIGMLFEVLRWEVAMRSTGDAFKLNNNYRSYYARLIMDNEADLAGVFQTRQLHAPAAHSNPRRVAVEHATEFAKRQRARADAELAVRLADSVTA